MAIVWNRIGRDCYSVPLPVRNHRLSVPAQIVKRLVIQSKQYPSLSHKTKNTSNLSGDEELGTRARSPRHGVSDKGLAYAAVRRLVIQPNRRVLPQAPKWRIGLQVTK